MLLRVTFASPHGPSLEDIRTIRAVSEIAARWSAKDTLAALRGVPTVVLRIDQGGDAAAATLRASGMSVDEIPRRDWRKTDEQLGFSAAAPGELRWIFLPAFDAEVVLSAREVYDGWELDLRRPRIPLAQSLDRPWIAPSAPEDLVPRVPEIDTWLESVPREVELETRVRARSPHPSSPSRSAPMVC